MIDLESISDDGVDGTGTGPGARPRAETGKKHQATVADWNWTPDKEVTSCEICHAEFGLWRRRHHCRKCGRCVCSRCAPQESMAPIPESGSSELVKQCTKCVPPR